MHENTMNEAGNQGGSVTVALPKEEYFMDLDLESTRRQLIALRVKHGAESPIGRRCSNIVELIQNLARAVTTEQDIQIRKNIGKQMAELDRLLKGSQ